MMITEYQRKLMEHTISDPDRNWFATGYNNKDSVEFEKLVKLGFATSQPAAEWMVDDVIYRLTRKGIEELNGRNDGK